MSTLFNRHFLYAELSGGHYNESGVWVRGDLVVRQIKGTLQEGASKDVLAQNTGSRNYGTIDVFSSEQLCGETRGGNEGGFVEYGGHVYRLENEQRFKNLMPHWKYTANRMLDNDIPIGVVEAFGL